MRKSSLLQYLLQVLPRANSHRRLEVCFLLKLLHCQFVKFDIAVHPSDPRHCGQPDRLECILQQWRGQMVVTNKIRECCANGHWLEGECELEYVLFSQLHFLEFSHSTLVIIAGPWGMVQEQEDAERQRWRLSTVELFL